MAFIYLIQQTPLRYSTCSSRSGIFFGGRLHGGIHETGRLLASEPPTFNINIPPKALIAVPYSSVTGIRELAHFLTNRKPFSGSICYEGIALPSDSIQATFLNQECLDASEQLSRILSAAKAGAKIILIAHMTEGLSPDAEADLRSSVKQLCSDLDVTVINEEYNRSALCHYEHSIELRHTSREMKT